MVSSKTLFDGSQLEIAKAAADVLANADTVVISKKLPHEQKVLSVIEQMGNPYCFLSGDTPVRVRFVREEKPLLKVLVGYLSQLKQT